MHVPAVGAACLGVFVSYLTWYFIVRLADTEFTVAGLGSVLGVVAGGVVVKLLQSGNGYRAAQWWYPIGLLVGFLFFGVMRLIGKKPWPALYKHT